MVIQILSENEKIFALEEASSILLKLIPFHSNGRGKYCDHAIPILIQNFDNHYLDLSKEVYNVSVPQENHDTLSKTCRSLVYRSGNLITLFTMFMWTKTFFVLG